jgi:N-acetylated-alpha-linked acidic dipeptidase
MSGIIPPGMRRPLLLREGRNEMQNRRKTCVALAGLLLVTGAAAPGAAGTSRLRGFDAAASARERADEARFLPLPSATGALAEARVLGAQPHYAGTAGDYSVAVFMRDRLRDFGFDATLETLRGRIDTPLVLSLSIEPAHGIGTAFDLREAQSPVDPDPGRFAAGLPFNYGSGDGDVRASLAYANRGLERDYATLADAGVDVRKSVVIVRYGAEFRGLLAERAQRHGAAGVIFYSDPKDDGFARGPAYPRGPWRPLGAVQRGMVSSGGLAIPTLPVTAQNARILLSALREPEAPPSWRGALPVAYRLGKSAARVHLVVRMRRRIAEMWNTIGTLRGSTKAMVILGGHRDAWVYGVTDNGSGITALLEAARGLGSLYRRGWRPRRGVVVAGWDAEEIGELGSRAYAGAHGGALQRSCVAYINADEVATGTRFSADAAAALAGIVIDAAAAVPESGGTRTVFDGWNTKKPDTPGGGSDHEVFLFDLGIPTAGFGFDGPFGVYHSAYDDLRYAATQADPGFLRHRTVAQLLGIVAMRLAGATAVPYTFAPYTTVMTSAAHGLVSRLSAAKLDVDVKPLDAAVRRFAVAARRFDGRIDRAEPGLDARALAAARDLDAIVYGALGYRSVAFPAVSQAVEARDARAARTAVTDAAGAIDRATALLSSSTPLPS